MLRKTKTQSLMNILSENNELTKISNEAEEILNKKENKIDVAEEQRSKKLDNKDNGYRTTKSVASAHSEMSTNYGGRAPEFNSDTFKSIWGENEKKEVVAKDEGVEKINKEDVIKYKKERKNPDDVVIANNYKAVVFSDEHAKDHTYKSPIGNIGLFDKGEFERLPEVTTGEKISKSAEKRKEQKDESWKNDGRAVSSKGLISNFFDNLSSKKE
jgi:hypothetical protein